MITPKVPHILYGGDYNPEQWPEKVWLEDVRLMREAGVNLVTVGVFSWALLEPRPGEYDFGWMDRVLDLLHKHEVMVDLATATASPPSWLARSYLHTLPMTREGVTLWPGSRGHFCPSSPAYRRAAAGLVERIAGRYRDHPALAMWHINNEYGEICYCDNSAEHFRRWLLRRYGSLDALNEAWGTAFWSQHYSSWEEVNPPRSAPTFINPTQQLDFQRFSSDALLECFEMEKAILRAATPEVPITTNFMGFFKPVDYWTWAEREDVVSTDSYPDPASPDAAMEQAMHFDLVRSLGGGQPWLLMEQTPGQVNWRPINVLKRPGQMRLWSYQALARGADGVLFFQWRQSKAGSEKFHSGMVPIVGTDNSRIWREVRELGAELKELDRLLDTRMTSQVAILFDWESWWGLELDAHPSAEVRLLEQIRTYYEPLYRRNVAVDFARPDADLSGYRVVLAPNLYMLRPGVAENMERFVAGGGTLVMSFFSGIVDHNDHIYPGGFPAPLQDVFGIRVEELDPYMPEDVNRIVLSDGRAFECRLWSDVIDLVGAEAIAVFQEDFYAGRPAVTRHRFGEGISYYVGTRPEPAYMELLLERVCNEADVRPVMEVPPGVEVTRRSAGEKSFLFVLNHRPYEVEVEVQGRDVVSGAVRSGLTRVEGFGVVVLEEDAAR